MGNGFRCEFDRFDGNGVGRSRGGPRHGGDKIGREMETQLTLREKMVFGGGRQ